MKFWETEKFRKLKNKWYNKAEKAGFEDAERDVGNTQVLKQNAAYAIHHMSPEMRESKLEYYSRLSECVQKEKFDKEIDRHIMRFCSEGLQIKEIVDLLKKLKMSRDRETVGFIIKRYEHKWMIKNWKPEQLRRIRK